MESTISSRTNRSTIHNNVLYIHITHTAIWMDLLWTLTRPQSTMYAWTWCHPIYIHEPLIHYINMAIYIQIQSVHHVHLCTLANLPQLYSSSLMHTEYVVVEFIVRHTHTRTWVCSIYATHNEFLFNSVNFHFHISYTYDHVCCPIRWTQLLYHVRVYIYMNRAPW